MLVVESTPSTHNLPGGPLIPAAFTYLRAHTSDEAFAHLQQYGAEARVLAGGPRLIPAMRFGLARPAVLVCIKASSALNRLRGDRNAVRVRGIAPPRGHDAPPAVTHPR